jgi:TRAP-type mannitol/chloroaromatic compound transport system substrate-binding protein
MAAYESYADGKITRDEFLQRRDQLASDTERLTAEKATLAAQLTALEQAQDSELHTTAEAASEFLKAEDVTNEMLRQFIDRVNVFTGGRIEIVYRFSNPFMDSLAELQAEPVSNQ